MWGTRISFEKPGPGSIPSLWPLYASLILTLTLAGPALPHRSQLKTQGWGDWFCEEQVLLSSVGELGAFRMEVALVLYKYASELVPWLGLNKGGLARISIGIGGQGGYPTSLGIGDQPICCTFGLT